MKLSKELLIEGKSVFIYDEILPKENLQEFYKQSILLPFKRQERDFVEDDFPIYSFDFQIEKFEEQYNIGAIARQVILENFPQEDFLIYRSYINSSQYGDMEYIHRDCDIDSKDITILVYLNAVWDANWGGETN